MSAGPDAEAAAGAELTGSADPLRLRVCAELDAGASALRLRCEVHNRLTAEARGVGLRCAERCRQLSRVLHVLLDRCAEL